MERWRRLILFQEIWFGKAGGWAGVELGLEPLAVVEWTLDVVWEDKGLVGGGRGLGSEVDGGVG
jgi:hypothetical protein